VGKVEDRDVVTAAILHDTIEDTDTKPEEIEELFGGRVLSFVNEVTDDKTLPKEVRKERQVETAPHKSSGAKQIKIADKISNLRDIVHSPPAKWSDERRLDYVKWSERVVAGLRGVNPALDNLYDQILNEAKQTLLDKK
jgi:guanosine-3',5'-bis(diphosphate) 3'-pyrophosphohydrolase